MELSEHPAIQELADTENDLLRFFSPVEQAVIAACKEICKGTVKNE